MRDITKCKTAKAEEYMTPDQKQALLDGWNTQNYVIRSAVNAPDWAMFIDRDCTAYSIEFLAEEWMQDGAEEGEMEAREVVAALAPQLVTGMIARDITKRVEAGELRAVVNSPDDWE